MSHTSLSDVALSDNSQVNNAADVTESDTPHAADVRDNYCFKCDSDYSLLL